MPEGYEALDCKCQMIVDEYDEDLGLFQQLSHVVVSAINDSLAANNMHVTAVEARIKQRDSLIGKLMRKGHLYQHVTDLTDIFGARIITLFSDDVDRVASYMAKTFDVIWERSTDKRKMHQLESFGYNSLHYICRVPRSLYHDTRNPRLNDIKFEIQMRSTLQHAWAAMNHDIGYKSVIETPPEYRRMFGRLASMLELADEEFSRIRISVADYRRRMEALIRAGELSDVQLDGDTFNAYIAQKPFDRLNQRIAAINQGEIHDVPFAPFYKLLKDAGMKTLQDVQDLIHDNEEDAYRFAMSQFADTDIDIIASTLGLQDLLIVDALKKGGGRPALHRIFNQLNGDSPYNEQLADMVYRQAANLPFMSR